MAKPPSTADEAVSLVRRSQLVPEPVLAEFLATRPELATAPPTDTLAALVKARLLTVFQAKLINQGRYKGFFLGGYKMLDQIGSGGMGQVFLAEHTSLRRKVALKVLPGRLAEEPTSVERFYREARAAAALDHPNIVRANDVRCESGTHFLVMEYVPGKTLQQLMTQHGGRLGWGEVAGYGVQIAAALQHAHDRGIVHRDIKPANVIIDPEGTVKVLDMGLARFFADTNDNLTQKINGKAMLGTADYVAPEQLMNSSAVDHRADVYSLGATLYQLLTGQPPFEGSMTAKLMAHHSKEPVPVHEVCPDLPPELSQVIKVMMAKDPGQRYQSAADVISALAPFVDGPSSAPLSSKLLPALASVAGNPSTTDLKPGLSGIISQSSYGQPRTPKSEINLEQPMNLSGSSTAIPFPTARPAGGDRSSLSVSTQTPYPASSVAEAPPPVAPSGAGGGTANWVVVCGFLLGVAVAGGVFFLVK